MRSFDAYDKGRRSFENGLEESDVWRFDMSKTQRQAWKSGYRDAQREAQREEEQQEAQEEWSHISSQCPWYVDGACMARRETDDPSCTKVNCAPYYFGSQNISF